MVGCDPASPGMKPGPPVSHMDEALLQTSFALAVGVQITAIAALPPYCCGCKIFRSGAFADHVCTCSAKTQLAQTFSEQPLRQRQLTHPAVGVSGVETSTWLFSSRTQRCLSTLSWTSASRTSVSVTVLTPSLNGHLLTLLMLT